MTRSRASSRARVAAAALAACLLSLNPSTARAEWPSASDGVSAWIAHETRLGQWALLRVTGAPPALKVRNAAWLPRPALRLGVDPESGRCVAVLRQDAGFHPVREITVTEPRSERAPEVFSTPAVLAPLPEAGRIVGVRVEREAVAVLREQPRTPGAASADAPLPDTALADAPSLIDLFQLTEGRWSPAAVGCIWNEPAAELDCVPAVPWPRHDGNAPVGATLLIAGDVYTTRREGPDIVIALPGPPALETARLRDIPLDSALVALSGQAVALWRNAEDDDALWCAAVTPLGVEVYRGPVSRDGLIPGREIVTLVTAFSMTALSLLVWVLVPLKWRQPITPAPGFTYAEVPRRGAATLVDLLPGFIAVETLLGVYSWAPPELLGPWPALAALFISAAVAAAGEAAFARSLGKWALRCELQGQQGTPLTRARRVARTLLKFACPPLTVLHLIVPAWKWTNPVSLGTAVVRKDPGHAPEPDA